MALYRITNAVPEQYGETRREMSSSETITIEICNVPYQGPGAVPSFEIKESERCITSFREINRRNQGKALSSSSGESHLDSNVAY